MLHIHRAMIKKKKTIVLNSDLVEWIEEMIKKKEFASLSHAISKALFKLRESYKKRENES